MLFHKYSIFKLISCTDTILQGMKSSWALPQLGAHCTLVKGLHRLPGPAALGPHVTHCQGPLHLEERGCVDWFVQQEASAFKTGPECVIKYGWGKTDLKTRSGGTGNGRKLVAPEPCGFLLDLYSSPVSHSHMRPASTLTCVAVAFHAWHQQKSPGSSPQWWLNDTQSTMWGAGKDHSWSPEYFFLTLCLYLSMSLSCTFQKHLFRLLLCATEQDWCIAGPWGSI